LKFKVETEFQETEIGKIPKEWRIEKLGRVVRYVKGRKPNNLYDEKLSEKHLPYLTAEYMRGLDKPKWCNPDLEDNILRVSSDDIVMIWDGSYAGHVFTGFEGILASTMIKITPLIDLDKKFLYYYLVFSFEKFRATTVGTGIPHVNKRIFNEFPIPLPPIREQKRISEIFSLIDEIIKSTNESIVRLERLKKALMRELLTGGIRVNEENGKLVFHRETEFQETEIGKIPKEWRVKKLLEIVEVWDKYRIPVKETNRKPGPYPYCGANGIIDYVDGYTHDGEFVLLAEDGGFFGPFEKSAYIMRGKFWANNHVHVLKPRKEFTDSEYLMYFLNYIDLTPYVTGTTRPKLNQASMKKIPITLPPIDEQKRIAKIFSLIDRAIELHREEKAKLDHLKKGLMNLLLTGKIRVLE